MPPHVGPGSLPVWYRFSLANMNKNLTTYSLLATDSMISDLVELKLIRGHNQVENIITGTSLPPKLRPARSLLSAIPFNLGANEQVAAYLGITSGYSRNLFYQIRTEADRIQVEAGVILFFGFYFGMMSLIAIGTLIIYNVSGEPVIRSYATLVIAAVSAAFVGRGFLNYLGPDDWIIHAAHLERILVPLLMASVCVFSRDYLETRKWCSLGWYYYNITLALCLGCAVVALIDLAPGDLETFEDNLIRVTTVMGMLVAAVGTWRRTTPFAWTYLIGFGIYSVGGNFWSMQFTMKIPPTWWATISIVVAQLIQNIIFSFAVLAQMRKRILLTTSAEESARYGERMGMFVRVLTHDLSNYISIIDGSVSLLQKSVDPAIQERAKQKITKALKQQHEVLESIKELKALEDGKASLTLEKVNIHAILAELPLTFENKLAAKNVGLEISKLTPEPVEVWADRKTLFHSVICNLVSNAIKFSDAKSVIEVTAETREDAVILHVKDCGIGMPDDLLGKIFSEGEKTSRLGTGGEKGTGFGLPICKAYMDLYQGSISVTSKTKDKNPDDHGTTFSLTFKRAA